MFTYHRSSNSSPYHSRGNNRNYHILECNRHRFPRTLLCTFPLGLYRWNHTIQSCWMNRSNGSRLTDTRQRDSAGQTRKHQARNSNQRTLKTQKGKTTEKVSYFQQWYQDFLCDLTERQEIEVSEVLKWRKDIWKFSLATTFMTYIYV